MKKIQEILNYVCVGVFLIIFLFFRDNLEAYKIGALCSWCVLFLNLLEIRKNPLPKAVYYVQKKYSLIRILYYIIVILYSVTIIDSLITKDITQFTSIAFMSLPIFICMIINNLNVSYFYESGLVVGREIYEFKYINGYEWKEDSSYLKIFYKNEDSLVCIPKKTRKQVEEILKREVDLHDQRCD